MMIEANVPKDLRHLVAQKVFEIATKLDGLVPTLIKGVVKSRVEHATGKIPPYVDHVRKWGEAGIVKTKTKQTAKMADRGIKCMMVGYANDHSGDTYEMLNWMTRKVMESRDIIWLNRMYFENNLNHEENKNEFQGDEYIDGAEEPGIPFAKWCRSQ